MTAADAAFALLLGAVAAFNPCGMALLPSYLTMLVAAGGQSLRERAAASVRIAAAVTVGFVAVFTIFGLLALTVSSTIQAVVLPWTPWITVALGLVIATLGLVTLMGKEVAIPGFSTARWSAAPRAQWWTQALYGVTFAVASLSCTIGPFLGVVSRAITAPDPFSTVAPFVIYAVGMGAVVLLLSIAAAVSGGAFAGKVRKHGPTVVRFGGAILLASGLAAFVYGLAEVLPKFGIRTLDPLLLTTGRWQGAVTVAIQSWGTPVLVGLVVVSIGLGLWLTIAAAAAKRRRGAG